MLALLGQEEEGRRLLMHENIELERRLREAQGRLGEVRAAHETLSREHADLVLAHDEMSLQNKREIRRLRSAAVQGD